MSMNIIVSVVRDAQENVVIIILIQDFHIVAYNVLKVVSVNQDMYWIQKTENVLLMMNVQQRHL